MRICPIWNVAVHKQAAIYFLLFYKCDSLPRCSACLFTKDGRGMGKDRPYMECCHAKAAQYFLVGYKRDNSTMLAGDIAQHLLLLKGSMEWTTYGL